MWFYAPGSSPISYKQGIEMTGLRSDNSDNSYKGTALLASEITEELLFPGACFYVYLS